MSNLSVPFQCELSASFVYAWAFLFIFLYPLLPDNAKNKPLFWDCHPMFFFLSLYSKNVFRMPPSLSPNRCRITIVFAYASYMRIFLNVV